MSEPTVVICDDLGQAIHLYRDMGYRLDMIFPADSPREALMSVLNSPASANETATRTPIRLRLADVRAKSPGMAHDSDWAAGRAGMEYRDLIPGRVGGRAIASHIRLTDGGPVADYVHYHKLEFQMIYCLKGRIKVVYEDQGPPFWLEPGDCVVQPPEIRHQVLECTAGAEVLEVSMPAEHETWVDHEMSLPNNGVNPGRDFCGQRFVLTRSPTGNEPD